MARNTLGGARSCPHCAAPLAARGIGPAIDRPFDRCAGCGAYVARSEANEWDLLRMRAKVGHVARHVRRALILGTPPVLVYAIFALVASGGWKPIELVLWLAAGWFLAGSWEGSRLATSIQRSRRRMGDPMYLAQLIEFQLAAVKRHASASASPARGLTAAASGRSSPPGLRA